MEDVIDEIYNDDDSRDEDYSPSDEESDEEDEDSSNNTRMRYTFLFASDFHNVIYNCE